MKNIILSIAIFFPVFTFAQKTAVPNTVIENFNKLFPNAKSVKWEKDGFNYEAEFKKDKKEYSVEYDSLGNWMETSYEIAKSELPSTVIASVDSIYKGCKYEEIEVCDSAPMSKHYEIEIKSADGKSFKLYYTLSGEFISAEEEKADSKD